MLVRSNGVTGNLTRNCARRTTPFQQANSFYDCFLRVLMYSAHAWENLFIHRASVGTEDRKTEDWTHSMTEETRPDQLLTDSDAVSRSSASYTAMGMVISVSTEA